MYKLHTQVTLHYLHLHPHLLPFSILGRWVGCTALLKEGWMRILLFIGHDMTWHDMGWVGSRRAAGAGYINHHVVLVEMEQRPLTYHVMPFFVLCINDWK